MPLIKVWLPGLRVKGETAQLCQTPSPGVPGQRLPGSTGQGDNPEGDGPCPWELLFNRTFAAWPLPDSLLLMRCSFTMGSARTDSDPKLWMTSQLDISPSPGRCLIPRAGAALGTPELSFS